MSDGGVILQRDGTTATVTLNNPERHNALTRRVKDELVAALGAVAADDGVRAVVLAGRGRSFCVGQDLAEHADALTGGADAAFATVRAHYSPIARSLLTMPKPVVAAVQGSCMGAGLGFALACDYRVFGADAMLGTAFSAIGLTFDSGLSYTLPRAVGAARASELMLFPRRLTADEAIGWGVTGEIANDPGERAHEIARMLADGPTRAYAATKTALLDGGALDLALDAEARAQASCGATADHRGAVTAFLGKQRPEFRGR